MRVLVTGARGQLGHDVVRLLESKGTDCLGVGSKEFDIADLEGTERFIEAYHPDAVIHCAAYTSVDKAELEDAKRCWQVNVKGTENIVKVCKKIDATLLFISTDYVFSGNKEGYYRTNDPMGAIGQYGRTKEEGERLVREGLSKFFIVRISWVFGINGNNFVKTMLRLGAQKEEVRVVCDQIGSPTYTKDLAALLCEMVFTEKYGIYHATNEGICSWAEFAEEIFRQAGLPTKVVPIPASEYPTAAARPMNSRLSKECLDEAGFVRLPDWKDALSRYLQEFREEEETDKKTAG